MRPIQFRWIEAFRAVAETGSTVQAAQVLNVDQSAVSRYIAALEGQLDLRLFDRRRRGFRLTSEGERLLGDAEAAIGALARFQNTAAELKRLHGGSVHILTSATLARGLLPAVIRTIRSRVADLKVQIEIVTRAELERKLDAQQFDLCAVALPVAYPREHTVALGAFPGVCLVPSAHPLAATTEVRLSDLEGEPLVSLPQGTVGRVRIDQLFREAEIGYRPLVEATAVALSEMVTAGLGIAIVDPFSAEAAACERVAIRRLEPTTTYEFGLLLPRRRRRSPLIEELCGVFEDQCLEIAATYPPSRKSPPSRAPRRSRERAISATTRHVVSSRRRQS